MIAPVVSSRKPMRRSLGAAASSSSRYLSETSLVKLADPGDHAAGRARLAASPAATGLPPMTTMGVLGAALVAALADGAPNWQQ